MVGPGPVLVFGSTGFLGWHVRAAAPEGDLRSVTRSRVRPGRPRAHGDFRWIEFATDDASGLPGRLDRLLEQERPRAVLQLAAIASGAECERDRAGALLANAFLPGEIAAACRRAGIRMVHASTDLVFGAAPAPPGGFLEDHDPAPLGVYGSSKAEGERSVLKAAPEALVVRLPLLFGPSATGNAGASDSLFAALERGGDVFLFDDEWRQPLEASLAARALLALCDRPDLTGLLHLPGPERLTRAEFGTRLFAAAIRRGAQFASAPEIGPRAARGAAESRPPDTQLADRRLRAELGPHPESLEQMIERAVALRYPAS